MVLLIRNMASSRCKTMVVEELKKLDLQYKSVKLGEVELCDPVSSEKLLMMEKGLKKSGLELMVSHNIKIIISIKEAIDQLIYSSDYLKKPCLSVYLCTKSSYDYRSLSKIFSEMEGITIEKYYIRKRIERVQEMIAQGGMSLTEISYRMQYSSVSHFSNQFKKETGTTPFNYKNRMQNQKRQFV